MMANTSQRGACWRRHCTKHCERARNEPIDSCASTEMQAVSIRPKTPPSAFALLPDNSWHVSPWSPRLHKGQRGQPCMPNKCSCASNTNIQKPSTDARGSRANILRRSSYAGRLSMSSPTVCACAHCLIHRQKQIRFFAARILGCRIIFARNRV